MAQKPAHFCAWPNCNNVTTDKYCADHCEVGEAAEREKKLEQLRRRDGRRGTSRERGRQNGEPEGMLLSKIKTDTPKTPHKI